MANRTYPSFLIYVDGAGEYRWRLQAANHKNIANSGEGYHNYADCRHAIDLVKQSANYGVWRTDEAAKGV